jgi:DNA-binding MarR family transcriptional regulator
MELRNRPYTVSELSKITGYSKPTLFYHLDKLCEAGFVQRIENGRKWVYYKITDKGIRAIRYEIAKAAILLAGGLISVFSGVLGLVIKKVTVEKSAFAEEVVRTPTVPEERIIPAAEVKTVSGTAFDIYLFLVALGVLLIAAYVYLRLKK